MIRNSIRKIDLLVLWEFVPFFVMGVAAFTLLMVAVTLGRDMMKYVADYHMTLNQVGYIFLLSLPQTVAYTFPMAILFSALLAFGKLSDTSQLTALRAGGIGFFRIMLPALVFTWFVVLGTFILNEKIAPNASRDREEFIQNTLLELGFKKEQTNIAYMEQDAGFLFAASQVEGNLFNDVKWLEFSDPKEVLLYVADEGEWLDGRWLFRNVKLFHLPVNGREVSGSLESVIPDDIEIDSSGDVPGNGNVGFYSLDSPELEILINRVPADIASAGKREPEEMSLQELTEFIKSDEAAERGDKYLLKLEGIWHMKISIPFASLIFTLLAAPLALAPQRSGGSKGIGITILLVFAYYFLTTFSLKVAESGVVPPIVSAWVPNVLFLIAGIILVMRFYIRSA